MEYMSAREAADKWGISQRRVAVLCSEKRIKEATMVGNMWIIPTSAEKPIDARSTRYRKTEDKVVKPFLKWAGGKGQLLKEIEKYVTVHTGLRGVEITEQGVLCLDKDENEVLVPGETVICALGQRSRTDIVEELRDSAPYVSVIGDAEKVSTITNAVYRGYHTALDI